MPFLKKIIVEGGAIGLWEITETTSDFSWLADTFAHDPNYLRLASEKRRTEFFAVRALLTELAGSGKTIRYTKAGRPFIEGEETNISISHSGNLAAVILHERKPGIDVERLGRKVREISHKFLSETELGFSESTDDPEKWMTVMWCAKEAVFKMAGAEGVDFIRHIVLKPFETGSSGIIEAEFLHSDIRSEITLHYFFLSGNSVVWGVF